MARRSKTKFALLGVLSHGPASGYDIKKFIDGSIGYFWNESFGQIYPMLKELEEQGLVRAKDEDQAGRRLYRMTAAGGRALDEYLREPPDEFQVRDEMLLKLFFGARIADEPLHAEFLEEKRLRMRRTLDTYEKIAADIRKNASGNPDAPFWLITLRKGVLSTEAELAWIEETLRELKRPGK